LEKSLIGQRKANLIKGGDKGPLGTHVVGNTYEPPKGGRKGKKKTGGSLTH